MIGNIGKIFVTGKQTAKRFIELQILLWRKKPRQIIAWAFF